ncbi:MAG: ATP-dependent DNA helicase RecG, partial [bacterium]
MSDISEISVRFVKGIGPKNSLHLNKLGINSVSDLFFYLPFRTEDRRAPLAAKDILSKIPIEENIFAVGVVEKITARKSPRRMTRLAEIVMEDAQKTGNIRLLAFKNRAKYMMGVVKQGDKIAVFGKVEATAEGLSMTSFEFEILKENRETLSFFRLVGVYRTAKGLGLSLFRRWQWNALNSYKNSAYEFIPDAVLKKLTLMKRSDAFLKVHFPANFEEQAAAYMRIKFEDFFIFECAVAYSHYLSKKKIKPQKYVLKRNLLSPWRKNLPFKFTNGQRKAINSIFADMRSVHPMNRLLQGDVGCGKTVVAVAAALLAKENSYQTVILAPTLPVAYQHYETVSKLLKGLGVKTVLLTGGMKKKEKMKTLTEISAGRAGIIIGTHTLLEENVKFKNLSLIVIDEQQRFGVHQRAVISGKGIIPDVLVLTATPIPRTLALALFGDLNQTEIRELPSGRQPVETLHLPSREAYEAVRKEVKKGFQAFIIYPLIEETEDGGSSAEAAYRVLSKEIFSDFRVALLHGKMKPGEKQKIMKDFSLRRTDILISTTVVEVGVDVPNATIMVVENADRFGLSTLHQLRGRIGRGCEKSYCIVTCENPEPATQKRLTYFLACNDGFALAERDLELRGAGQYFGVS